MLSDVLAAAACLAGAAALAWAAGWASGRLAGGAGDARLARAAALLLRAGADVCHGRLRLYYSRAGKKYVLLEFTEDSDVAREEEFDCEAEAVAALLERSGMGDERC